MIPLKHILAGLELSVYYIGCNSRKPISSVVRLNEKNVVGVSSSFPIIITGDQFVTNSYVRQCNR